MLDLKTVLIILLQFLSIPFWMFCSKSNKKTSPQTKEKKDARKTVDKPKSKSGPPPEEPTSSKAAKDNKEPPDAAPVQVQDPDKLPSETF